MNRRCTTHHYACPCREEKFATLEKDNLRLRVEQAKFRVALEKIADQPKGLDYERFAKHTASRVLGRKKH